MKIFVKNRGLNEDFLKKIRGLNEFFCKKGRTK